MSSRLQYVWWVVGLVGFELVSWLSFSFSDSGKYLASPFGLGFSAVIALAIFLAWRRPTWLAWVTLVELIVGGKGYLFFVEVNGEKLSLRLALFTVLIFAWLIRIVVQKKSLPQWSWPPLALLGWVMVMSAVGWWRGYGPGAVFTDMNGYLYITIVWPWWYFLRRDSIWRERLVIVLLAGATFIGLKSWLMQLLFAQNAAWISELYRWIRQTGIGEITLISKNVYRIFFQSQIYALLGFVVVLVGFILRRHQPWWGWALIGSSLGVYLSLSRSLWLGLGVATVAIITSLVWRREWRHLIRFWILLPTGVFVWMMTTWALNFPYVIPPPGKPSNADAVVARLKSAGSQQASTARANQIPPLIEAIQKNPITGHGFGATVTYYSTDPRIRGSRTTSAFELGYLDMLLHIGFIGVGLVGWWIWRIGQRLALRPDGWLWILPTLALVTVHLTSPYLNHPLGLGWLGLMTILAYDDHN